MNKYEILYKKNGKPEVSKVEAINLHSLVSKLVVDMDYPEFKSIYKINLIK